MKTFEGRLADLEKRLDALGQGERNPIDAEEVIYRDDRTFRGCSEAFRHLIALINGRMRVRALEEKKAEPVEAEEMDLTCPACGANSRCGCYWKEVCTAANRRIKAAHREALESAAEMLRGRKFLDGETVMYQSTWFMYAADLVSSHVVKP